MAEALRRGALVGGFRIEHALDEGGGFGEVYEATQLSLDRTVALRLIGRDLHAERGDEDEFRRQQRLAAALHHPNAVPTYEAGAWEGGTFVATRFVRGMTLDAALATGSLRGERAEAASAQIASALGAAHEVGLIHGAVSGANVLIDGAGDAQLADLGLGRPGSREQDLADLEALTRRIEAERGRTPRGSFLLVGIAVAAVAVVALALSLSGEDPRPGPEDDATPAVSAGTEPFGSDLAPGSADALGCDRDPDSNTQVCTVLQSSTGGTAATAPSAGVVRRWAVRGATGEMALQVIGFRNGEPFRRAFSAVERAPDAGAHEFAANLPIERGDAIGVVLSPGSTIGSRSGGADTDFLRWEGTPPLFPQEVSGRRFAGEVLLRADVAVGERPRAQEITGSRAESAPAGQVLGSTAVETPAAGKSRLEVVRVDGGIAIDLRRKGDRISRLAVTDVDADGTLIALEPDCGYPDGFCLRWSNGAGSPSVFHAYRVTERGLQLIG